MATAASYLVSPAALGEAATDPARVADRLSARYLIALAGRVVREVGDLARRADARASAWPTLALDTEIRVPLRRRAGRLHRRARRHGPRPRRPLPRTGRPPHRLVVGAHPVPAPSEEDQ